MGQPMGGTPRIPWAFNGPKNGFFKETREMPLGKNKEKGNLGE